MMTDFWVSHTHPGEQVEFEFTVDTLPVLKDTRTKWNC